MLHEPYLLGHPIHRRAQELHEGQSVGALVVLVIPKKGDRLPGLGVEPVHQLTLLPEVACDEDVARVLAIAFALHVVIVESAIAGAK